MDYQNILLERPGNGVGLVRLNRPKVLNALDQATMNELVGAFDELERDQDVGAVVLTGNERAFAAGADIAELVGRTAADMLADYRFGQWARLRDFSKPTIAAITGLALGGGLELALSCDILIASETARMGQPEINLGLMPGAGGTQRLTRAVGKSLAMEMILNARTITADEALGRGLVSRVVPAEACLPTALELAREIAARAPVAVRLARASIDRALDTTLEQGLQAERHDFYLLFATDDAREGTTAFLEKRKPSWKGR